MIGVMRSAATAVNFYNKTGPRYRGLGGKNAESALGKVPSAPDPSLIPREYTKLSLLAHGNIDISFSISYYT